MHHFIHLFSYPDVPITLQQGKSGLIVRPFSIAPESSLFPQFVLLRSGSFKTTPLFSPNPLSCAQVNALTFTI